MAQKYEQIIWRKVACCSYTTPLKRNTCYESFSGTFLSNCSFVLLWVAGSERLHSKASLLKTTKAYKDQSKTGKAQRERLYCGPVLEALPCNFIKTGFHHQEFSDKLLPKAYLNDWLERAFIKISLKLRGNKTIRPEYSIKKMKHLSKFTGKNIWWSSFIEKLQSQNLTEGELYHGCFPITFVTFFRTATLKIAC